jgi:hypothetical protein
MQQSTSSLAQVAQQSYFAGLKTLTEWQQSDRRRFEHPQPDSVQHLITGLMILLEIGNKAAAVFDAMSPDDPSRDRFGGAIIAVGFEFDKLSARYHAMLFSQGAAPLSC